MNCALAIQRLVAEEIQNVAADHRMRFRIGAHVGEVRIEGDRLFGDTVNITARLEGAAEAGGISLSQQAYEQVRAHVDVAIEDLGEQKFKNIAFPVRAYGIGEQTIASLAMELPQTHGMTTESVNSLLAMPTIAVLPFVNLSSDPEPAHLADGITADLITGLSCDPRFAVIAHNSVMQFQNMRWDIEEVVRKLAVR